MSKKIKSKSPGRISRLAIRAFQQGDEEAACEVIKKAIESRDDHILRLQRHIEEHLGRKSLPVEDRYLEVVDVKSSRNGKLTINPRTGRVTLKISDGIKSDVIRSEMVELAYRLMNAELPAPTTFRGPIKFHNGYYECYMQSEGNRHTFYIRSESKEKS